ncbi:initiator tRNA phosphoribosyl transferase [Pseudogymnoascus sp. WSF 3629]|nr:initiator tRNA phosphoribosyl transferase [Pseudogymnoascus sp. WSF 3629]
MPPPATASDLIFSEQANHNFSKTLGDIKRHTLSIHNRLQSILVDAAFVQSVSEAYCRPLVANERCGSWYINPEAKSGSAYFKSTDGHTGVWKFSTRRLNTHLLELIGKGDGCIIVDSTRRGKRMPDALSKTIPIWCSVINRSLFPDKPEYHNLYTPPQAVSSSEHAQIAARLDDFAKSFAGLGIDMNPLREHISKPIRPLWVTPESALPSALPVEEQVFSDYHPVVCCTASRRVAGGEVSEGGYIQGSGDDTENWAYGLTPTVFWPNSELLLSTPESELPSLITELVSSSSNANTGKPTPTLLPPTSSLYVTSSTSLAAQPATSSDIIITISSEITAPSSWQKDKHSLEIGIGSGKIGSRNLRSALPHMVDFVKKSLSTASAETESPRIVVACPDGKDLSIGVALAILCILYDDNGDLLELGQEGSDIDKAYIRRRLGWIMTAMPDSNPSRSTLQSVNSYLMIRPS